MPLDLSSGIIFCNFVVLKKLLTMKIAIIGAGNMGGAIACGLAASGEYKAGEIVCSNPS